MHLDADVLDDRLMPAVDDRQPDGLSYAELGVLLAALLGSDQAVGMEVTIYDPTLDPDGRLGTGFDGHARRRAAAFEQGHHSHSCWPGVPTVVAFAARCSLIYIGLTSMMASKILMAASTGILFCARRCSSDSILSRVPGCCHVIPTCKPL